MIYGSFRFTLRWVVFFVFSPTVWGHFLYSPRGARSSITSCFIHQTAPWSFVVLWDGTRAIFFFFGTTCPMVEALQFSLHAAASPFRPRATLNTTRKRARLEGCSIRWAFKIKSSMTNVTLNKTRTWGFFFKHVVNIKYSIVNPRNNVNFILFNDYKILK